MVSIKSVISLQFSRPPWLQPWVDSEKLSKIVETNKIIGHIFSWLKFLIFIVDDFQSYNVTMSGTLLYHFVTHCWHHSFQTIHKYVFPLLTILKENTKMRMFIVFSNRTRAIVFLLFFCFPISTSCCNGYFTSKIVSFFTKYFV